MCVSSAYVRLADSSPNASIVSQSFTPDVETASFSIRELKEDNLTLCQFPNTVYGRIGDFYILVCRRLQWQPYIAKYP